MSETLILKVVCNSCERVIGEVYRAGNVDRYRPIISNGGVGTQDIRDTLATPKFWCLDHGYANPADVLAKCAKIKPGRAVPALWVHVTSTPT